MIRTAFLPQRMMIPLAAAMLVLAGARPSWSLDAEDIVARAKATLEEPNTIRVEFTATVESVIFGGRDRTSGTIFYKKPDYYRIVTPEQTVVAGDSGLWVFSPKNGQVTFSRDASGFNPVSFIEEILSTYRPVLLDEPEIDGAGTYRVGLYPESLESGGARDFQDLVCTVDASSYLVRRLEYIDASENEVVYEFSNYAMDRELPDSIFTFTIPDGVELIDLD